MTFVQTTQRFSKPLVRLIGAIDSWLTHPIFTQRDVKSATPNGGEVFIVGAGPGDAQLLTLKAYQLLQSADVVLFDWLVDESVLALIPRHVKRKFVGKRSGKHSMAQSAITQRMVALAQRGNRVVRLKGGDPAVFARTVEETDALTDAQIPFAIVPGITTASGASAFTGIPLTERECAQGVRLITAHQKNAEAEPDWQQLAASLNNETLVFYMGLKKLPTIGRRLLNQGVSPSMPCAVIDRACCHDQRIVKGQLGDITARVNQAELKGPALLIFGHVVDKQQGVCTDLLSKVGQIHGV